MQYKGYLGLIFGVLLFIFVATVALGYTRTPEGALVFDYENRPELVQMFEEHVYLEGVIRQHQFQCGLRLLSGPLDPVILYQRASMFVAVQSAEHGLYPDQFSLHHFLKRFPEGIEAGKTLPCEEDITNYLMSKYSDISDELILFIETENEDQL
jgi:hypothetical protein